MQEEFNEKIACNNELIEENKKLISDLKANEVPKNDELI